LRTKYPDPNDTTPLRDRRHLLSKGIQSLSSPQRVYIPGVSRFLDDIDPATVTETPEIVKLWLPSQLPPTSRESMCIDGLPHLELRLRLVQAYDALDLIRRLRGLYQALLVKNQVHVSNSQGTQTRAKALFTSFSLKINQAASRYCDARVAILRLDPDEKFSQWKENLRELHREDIRGPSREANETSESRQQISWIWQAASSRANAGINDPDLQAVMRVEWCKATARAERYREEVELVVEEMRRTLHFFKWAAEHWEQLGKARANEPTMDGVTATGLRAYAARKAALYRKLTNVFIQDWYACLERKSLGSSWLPEYPRPETSQRRRLRSNVEAYHSVSQPQDAMDGALINDPPSETEDVGGDVETDFDDV